MVKAIHIKFIQGCLKNAFLLIYTCYIFGNCASVGQTDKPMERNFFVKHRTMQNRSRHIQTRLYKLREVWKSSNLSGGNENKANPAQLKLEFGLSLAMLLCSIELTNPIDPENKA